MPSPSLSVLTLATRALPKAARFYRALGFKPGFANADVAFFQMNGSVLSLYRAALLARDLKLSRVRPPRPGGMNPAINLGNAKAVDAFYKKALKAGAKSIRAPHKAEWGGYTCYFKDPDGHPWEIAWNPFWKLDKKGGVRMA